MSRNLTVFHPAAYARKPTCWSAEAFGWKDSVAFQTFLYYDVQDDIQFVIFFDFLAVNLHCTPGCQEWWRFNASSASQPTSLSVDPPILSYNARPIVSSHRADKLHLSRFSRGSWSYYRVFVFYFFCSLLLSCPLSPLTLCESLWSTFICIYVP